MCRSFDDYTCTAVRREGKTKPPTAIARRRFRLSTKVSAACFIFLPTIQTERKVEYNIDIKSMGEINVLK
ncbi:MAG: hypothetical protein AAGU08_15445, partial [Sporomusa sphaeroides]